MPARAACGGGGGGVGGVCGAAPSATALVDGGDGGGGEACEPCDAAAPPQDATLPLRLDGERLDAASPPPCPVPLAAASASPCSTSACSGSPSSLGAEKDDLSTGAGALGAPTMAARKISAVGRCGLKGTVGGAGACATGAGGFPADFECRGNRNSAVHHDRQTAAKAGEDIFHDQVTGIGHGKLKFILAIGPFFGAPIKDQGCGGNYHRYKYFYNMIHKKVVHRKNENGKGRQP